MNWFQKISATIMTQDLPQILVKALEYECGGKWESTKLQSWTEGLERITGNKELSREKGYSTSFWLFCITGDQITYQKWGVSVTFTVLSGTSHTTIDSSNPTWDFLISANVQWASPNSWTQQSPYPLLIKTVGQKDDISTIPQFVEFVKQSILSIRDDDSEDDNDDDNDDLFPTWPYDESINEPETDEDNIRDLRIYK